VENYVGRDLNASIFISSWESEAIGKREIENRKRRRT
jgi:hypothetical protein